MMTGFPEAFPASLDGRKLSNDELASIRKVLEAMDSFDAVTPEMRALIEAHWPDLAKRLPQPT